MNKQQLFLRIVLFVSVLGWVGCDRVEVLSPQGPRGFSAYEVWVNAIRDGKIKWDQGTDLANYFKFIKGEKGDTGQDAYSIWREWISDGSVDDPHDEGKKWSPKRNTKKDFYFFLTGARGEDGLTPFVNEKGNWQIGDRDTGIPAKGKDGTNGKDGQNGSNGLDGDRVEIKEGYWHINGENTNIPATGSKGKPGQGKSAYTMWVEDVQASRIWDRQNNLWPTDKTDLEHFWYYLQGKSPDGTGDTTLPSVDVEETMFRFVRIEEFGDHHMHGLRIYVETESGAKVFYQNVGLLDVHQSLSVTEPVLQSDGANVYMFLLAPYGSEHKINIWARKEGKPQSPQMIINVGRYYRDIPPGDEVPEPLPIPKPQPKPIPKPQPKPIPKPQPKPVPEPHPIPQPIPEPGEPMPTDITAMPMAKISERTVNK